MVAVRSATAARAARGPLPDNSTTKEVRCRRASARRRRGGAFQPDGSRRTGDKFAGTERKAAKLSISTAAIENFADISSLLASLPKKDRRACPKPPGRSAFRRSSATSGCALLYAASREPTTTSTSSSVTIRQPPSKMMTMEISGCRPPPARPSPPEGRPERLQGLLQRRSAGPRLDHDPKRIPVEIEGSLFFDASHDTGTPPGPKKLRPFMPRIWEVHPISKIVFEP